MLRYTHTITLTPEEEKNLQELKKKKIKVIDVFRKGLKSFSKLIEQ